MRSSRKALAGVLTLSAAPLLADVEVPLRNWTIPPYRTLAAGGGLSALVDISNGIGFVAVTPCRIADTRGLGFTGQAGPPVLDTGTRTFQIAGTVPGVPAQCGIPPGADAVSFQFTIVSPNSNGNLVAWPAGGPVPTISVLNWTAGETALGNGTIVPLGGGALSVRINAAVGSATGHLVIDVNGYFTNEYPAGLSFEAISETAAPAILAKNTSVTGAATAVQGTITSATPGAFSSGVIGINNGTAGAGIGVWGLHFGSGFGVQGNSVTGRGVYGRTSSTSGRHYGVFGETLSTDLSAAGVLGVDGGGRTDENPGAPGFAIPRAGVRGESRTRAGVLGLTHSGYGVRGDVASVTTGEAVVTGILGYFSSGTVEALHAVGDIHVAGDSTITGMKSFVQPHPSDPGKEIRYVSLEGPQAEVYFRGSAQVSMGVTRIPVPDYFRMVAAPDSYSALVTPVGAMATVAVLAKGERGIVVEASRDVKVDYVVYAERAANKQASPIVVNTHFRAGPDMDYVRHLPDSYRELMIRNGTLNPDGTVNQETARRLGWDKEWEKRARPAAPTAD